MATISINLIFKEDGLIAKVREAKDKNANAQALEESALNEYGNKIDSYIYGSREDAVTLTKEQYKSLISRIDALEKKTTPTVLWTGEQSSGTLTLNDSIYNYSYLIFKTNYCVSAIVAINKSGMSSLQGGWASSAQGGDETLYGGFWITPISEDGKTLTLVRSGSGNYNSTWTITKITEIQGIL